MKKETRVMHNHIRVTHSDINGFKLKISHAKITISKIAKILT